MLESWTLPLIIAMFSLGYLAIICESFLRVNKATTALALASCLWLILNVSADFGQTATQQNLKEHFLGICEFIFFLWGAMIIVEIINDHKGLEVISHFLNVRSKRLQLWLFGFFSFFLSAILDNLTTTIVMITIIRKLCPDPEERKILGGAVVIAANAGGAWTPIGDVTTTMLWIGGQVTTVPLMKELLMPSALCVIASFFVLNFYLKGKTLASKQVKKLQIDSKGVCMGCLGFLALVSVPVFKVLTGFPPFVGMLLAMSLLGIISDLVDRTYKEEHPPFHRILHRVDTSTILFFLGILLSVDALETSGILHVLAQWTNETFSSVTSIAFSVGVFSSIIDNVPLVKACMGMYSLEQYPQNHSFWQLIAYSAGVGGNLLVIGSAAGIAFMGMERVGFFWYIKHISFAALVGYLAGFGYYLLQQAL